ncbi:MAG: hypothetical protein U0992_10065 [Planctomycetaceae bacterium]
MPVPCPPRERRFVPALLWLIAVSSPAAAQPLLPGPEIASTNPAPPCDCTTTARHIATTPPLPTDANGALIIDVHESLLNRIIGRTDQRQSPVRDFVLGADVHGVESTTTSISINLRESAQGVGLDLVLSGNNRSETVGYTPQAAIQTLGQHRFTATKFVLHDGNLFRTERPHVDVVPFNQTVGANTPVSGVPLLGPLASSIAFQAAESQRSAGEAIAAQKIREGVGTEFNRRIDAELARLNRGWLDHVMPALQQYGFSGLRIQGRSSQEWAQYSVRIADGATATERVPTPVSQPVPTRRVTAQRLTPTTDGDPIEADTIGRLTFRDAALNDSLSRLGLAGATIRMADVVEPATALLSVLDTLQGLGIEIEPVPPEAIAAIKSLTVRFDDQSPLQIMYANNEIVIDARAALTLPPLVDLPMTPITLRYTVDNTTEDAVSLRPAGFKLQPSDGGGFALGSIIAPRA